MKKGLVIAVIAFIVLGATALVQQSNQEDSGTDMPMTNDSTSQGASTTDNDNSAVQSGTVMVDIVDFAFAPEVIRVEPGTTVTWTNRDTARHDVHPDDPTDAFGRSELLAQGESYSVTFNDVGEYSYFCSPHPYMQATVIVEEV